MFAIGMEPFVAALRAGGRFPKAEQELGEIIIEAYKVVSFWTRLNQSCERVVSSHKLWQGLERHLIRRFRGDTLASSARGPGRATRPVLPVERGRSALGLPVQRPSKLQILPSFLGTHWVVTFFLAMASPDRL